MTTLTEFLLARIEDDEAAAERAERHAGLRDEWADDWVTDVVPQLARQAPVDVFRFLAEQTPARMLAECAAKRRIVHRCTKVADVFVSEFGDDISPILADEVLADLALPYADHPDYDEAWRP